MVSVVSMVFVSLVVEVSTTGSLREGCRRYPGSPATIPERLWEKFDVCVDALAFPRRRLSLRRPEVEEGEHALAASDADRLSAARRPQNGGRAPVRRKPP